MNFIKEHNKKFEAGEETFSLGPNEFLDIHNDEFR